MGNEVHVMQDLSGCGCDISLSQVIRGILLVFEFSSHPPGYFPGGVLREISKICLIFECHSHEDPLKFREFQ